MNLVAPGGPIALNRSGYLYIWVSNETTGWDVYYDNLIIQYKQGPLLEENHYYPFGLTMAGISDKAIKTHYSENKYRYNAGTELQNKEFSDGTGLEYYDAAFRRSDPQLGRFSQLDPLAVLSESSSPYQFADNNPVSLADPSGLKAPDPKDWQGRNFPSNYAGYNPFAEIADMADEAMNYEQYWASIYAQMGGGTAGALAATNLASLNQSAIQLSEFVPHLASFLAEALFGGLEMTTNNFGQQIIRIQWTGTVYSSGSITGGYNVVHDLDIPVNFGVDSTGPGGKPSLEYLKKNPPNVPGFVSPKSGDQKVRNPNGSGTGWLDRKGRVWVPNDNNGNHAPHWDVQDPKGGGYENVYPTVSTTVQAGVGAVILVSLWETVKWGIGVLGAPETGGASLTILALP